MAENEQTGSVRFAHLPLIIAIITAVASVAISWTVTDFTASRNAGDISGLEQEFGDLEGRVRIVEQAGQHTSAVLTAVSADLTRIESASRENTALLRELLQRLPRAE